MQPRWKRWPHPRSLAIFLRRASFALVASLLRPAPRARWLDQPLPVFTRVIALALLAGGLWLLSLQLGVSVGLFVGLWVFTLPALLVPLLVSHYRDSYQRRGGNR